MAKFLFFLIAAYLIFRVISRFVIPFLLKTFLGRMTDRMSDMTNQYKQQTDNRTEGEVIIESRNQDESEMNEVKKGDYVDFEEVE